MKNKLFMGLVIAIFAGFFVIMSVRTGPWALNDVVEKSFELHQLESAQRRNEAKITKLREIRTLALARENQLIETLQQQKSATDNPETWAEYDAMIQNSRDRITVLERRYDAILAE